MSVASSNPFALLPDNAADTDVRVSASKQAKKAPAKTSASGPASERARPSERAVKRDYPARGGMRRTISTRDASGEDSVIPTHDKGRSRVPARRGGRGNGTPRAGRRQFDRHSGTGLVDSQKKEKQGWLGDDKAVVEDGEKAAEEAKRDSQDGVATPVEEEEEVVKTLDDYLKEQKPSTIDSDRKIRKANDAGVDKSQLKNTVTLDKKDEMFFAPIASQKARKQKERKEKVFIDIEQRFVDEQRRGAFRGGRGGARGNNGPRRGGPRQPRVNVNDQSAFPSL